MPSYLDDETFALFLEESKEHLSHIEEDILTMEDMGEDLDEDLVNKIFRAAHTIKGGASFFSLSKVKELAHGMENLLGLIRSHDITVTSGIISALLDSADVLRQMLNSPDNVDDFDITESISELKKATVTSLPEERKKSVDTVVDIKRPSGETIFSVSELEIANAQRMERGGSYIYLLEYDMMADIQKKGKTPWEIISEMLQLVVFINSKIDTSAVGTLFDENKPMRIPFYVLCSCVMDPEIMAEFVGLPPEQVIVIYEKRIKVEKHKTPANTGPEKKSKQKAARTKASEPQPQTPPPAKPSAESQKVESVKEKSTPKEPKKAQKSPSESMHSQETVRVRLQQLDKLMTLAGEMVLTRNELVQKTSILNNGEIESVTHRVNAITSDLQEAIMATRMQSVGIVFTKFKRIVRDMAKQLGKQIDLTLHGEEVELDKTIIEAIGDPLTHLIRNSVDHGIETPDVRSAAGKQPEGQLTIRAFHQAGQVLIEIEDDGAGINTEKVKAKALEKKLYSEADLDAMAKKDLDRLIFTPGFSTAREVTDISGRGVGMDVVQSNLSKVGGTVDLESEQGKGMVVRIKLPLTLAIVPSLLVSVQKERFAIPQVNLIELVRIQAKDVKSKIEKIGDASILRLRGALLPLVELADVLDIPRTVIDSVSGEEISDRRTNIADRRSVYSDAADAKQDSDERRKDMKDRRVSFDSACNIAVVASGDFHYGIIVDSLLDSEEIVVKPLGSHLKRCKEYAGATILGDGHVALILDIVGIKNCAHLHTTNAMIERQKVRAAEQRTNASGDMQSLLIVENGVREQFAIPLGLVERIEKIKAETIEKVGGKLAITYRNTTLPLLSIEQVAKVSPRKDSDIVNIIVFKAGGQEVGILVSKIIDILDTDATIETTSYVQPGILGAVIINDTITLMLDLFGIVDTVLPELSSHSPATVNTADSTNKTYTILVVEDSRFFLNQITSFLQEAGYNTLTAENGEQAIAVLEKEGDRVDLVLTDIEMPVMDGFEMTRQLRERPQFSTLPVLAVTSVSGDAAEKKGEEVGINKYLIKLDREQILTETAAMIQSGVGVKKQR